MRADGVQGSGGGGVQGQLGSRWFVLEGGEHTPLQGQNARRGRKGSSAEMTFLDSTEKDRFSSRLATIPGVYPLPSVGDWILLQVESPSELARKVNRRLAPGSLSVPRGIDGAVRVHIGEPKQNEALLRTLRDVVE